MAMVRLVPTVISAATSADAQNVAEQRPAKADAAQRRAGRRCAPSADRRASASAAQPRSRCSTATAPPATPSRGNGPQPKIRHGDSGISDRRADAGDDRRHRHVAGAADDVGERVEEPHQDRAGKDDVGVGQRRGERRAAAAHRCIEPGPAERAARA